MQIRLLPKKSEEDEAVMKMKSNPKTFFSFARARQKVKAMIGPFIDQLNGTPNPSPDFAAEELRKQYNSVFASSRPAWAVNNFQDHFKAGANSDIDGSLLDFSFNQEDIERLRAERPR